jgi:glucose/arabinose dehydrogenase
MRRSLPALAVAAFLLSGCDLPALQPAERSAAASQAKSVEDPEDPEPRVAAAGHRIAVPARLPAPDAQGQAPTTVAQAGVAAATEPRVTGGNQPARQVPDVPFASTEVARFDQPWAMTFLPDGRLLVTEKGGKLKLANVASRQVGEITGVPNVAYGGQGGLGDVVLHPQFASNRLVYLSYAEAGSSGTRGAVVARAQLQLAASGNGGSLTNLQVLWRQAPKVSGDGHYSHRIAFDAAGRLWISSGDRQKLEPAQDLQSNLGKILRLNDDGSVPADNPFAAQGGEAAKVWSYGHRNVLGLAFDAQGRLWEHEMGPAGGDELNRVERGSNYGWPRVSNGNHYDGANIPDHAPGDGYNAPEVSWTQTIAPSGFVIYSGDMFPFFRGHGFIGGLASQALIRVEFSGNDAREAQRYPMGQRIREVEQGPDGAIWLLEDGSNARLLKLTRNF